MKKSFVALLSAALLAVVSISMTVDAVARPMGGGRSFGRQSPTVARQAAQPQQAARPTAPTAPGGAAPAMAPKPPSPWRGIVGGALLGLGMGALLSHFGMGGGAFGAILMFALLGMAAWFILRMLRGKPAGGQAAPFAPYAPSGAGNVIPMARAGAPDYAARVEPQAFPSAQLPSASPVAPWGVPANFDSAGFLRYAKSSFIRMQAAWDKADVGDLREFTTPEVFAELRMQIQERGAAADFTDVVTIDAELLGMETMGDDYLASVKFTGMIKTAPGAAAEPFSEVWNMAKAITGNGPWVLAGIQQLH